MRPGSASLLFWVFLSLSASAQDDGGTDAGPDDAGTLEADAGGFGVPDGSVGEGGADRDNEEGEDTTGRAPSVCSESSDCAAGFVCRERRCAYIGIRRAEGGFGCGGMAVGVLFPLALFFRAGRHGNRC